MAEDLVLHYQGVNRLLGSPARLNRALAVAAGVLLIASAGRLLSGGRALGDLAVYVAGVSAIAILVLGYGRLRFANAGIFLTNGRVGVIGTLGGRTGVDVSQVDHFQRCTLSPANARPYRVLLFVDRGGSAALRLPTADLISEEGLAELARRTGIPLRGSWDDKLSPGEMAKRFPGSVPRITLAGGSVLAHPVRTRLITMGVTFVAVVILGIVLIARSN
jgi:hypothetical protein